jgi:NAD-dependent dihydropyrimidine dehydrogenase PreA subunit
MKTKETDRFEGGIDIMGIIWSERELCSGCGICERICPLDVFRMDKELKKAIIKYPEDCQLCELCVIDCPTGALKVTPEKTAPLLLSWG